MRQFRFSLSRYPMIFETTHNHILPLCVMVYITLNRILHHPTTEPYLDTATSFLYEIYHITYKILRLNTFKVVNQRKQFYQVYQ